MYISSVQSVYSGKKVQQRNLKNFFLKKDRLICCKYLLLRQQVWKFFPLISKKIGSVEQWEVKHFIGMALPFRVDDH